MTHPIVPTLIVALCAPLMVTGCASNPDHIAWIDEPSSTEYTVVPARKSPRRASVAVYPRRRAVSVEYRLGPFRFSYRPAPTIYR